MAYNEFAYFYDEFNGEADYDALYGYITDELKAHASQTASWPTWAAAPAI